MLDNCNYSEGVFCPLAVALDLSSKLENPTDEKVVAFMEGLGYSVYNTRGIKGYFYTSNRRADLFQALDEVLEEKLGILR